MIACIKRLFRRPWKIVVWHPRPAGSPGLRGPHIRVVAANGEIVLPSENYASDFNALRAAERLAEQTGWAIEHDYEMKAKPPIAGDA